MTRNADGETIFSYTYARATAKPATYIPFVGAFAGGADVQTQTLTVTFGTNGVVKDFVTSYGATESGLGASAASKADLKEVEQGKRPK